MFKIFVRVVAEVPRWLQCAWNGNSFRMGTLINVGWTVYGRLQHFTWEIQQLGTVVTVTLHIKHAKQVCSKSFVTEVHPNDAPNPSPNYCHPWQELVTPIQIPQTHMGTIATVGPHHVNTPAPQSQPHNEDSTSILQHTPSPTIMGRCVIVSKSSSLSIPFPPTKTLPIPKISFQVHWPISTSKPPTDTRSRNKLRLHFTGHKHQHQPSCRRATLPDTLLNHTHRISHPPTTMSATWTRKRHNSETQTGFGC